MQNLDDSLNKDFDEEAEIATKKTTKRVLIIIIMNRPR
jgi:hypothetical protein